MVDTLGRDMLNQFLEGPPARSQKSLAEAVDTTQTNVSAWCRGVARPGPEYRRALRIVAGIPEDAWLTDDEEAVIEKATAHAAQSPAAGTHGA